MIFTSEGVLLFVFSFQVPVISLLNFTFLEFSFSTLFSP